MKLYVCYRTWKPGSKEIADWVAAHPAPTAAAV
jgi:hypothetical protein